MLRMGNCRMDIIKIAFEEDREEWPKEYINLQRSQWRIESIFFLINTHECCNKQGKNLDVTIWVASEKVGRKTVVFISAYCLESENVEWRWEKYRKGNHEPRRWCINRKTNNGEDDTEERSHHSSQLWCIPKRCCDEQRPTREDQSQQDVKNEDQSYAGFGENTKAPEEANDDPSR